MDLSHDVKRSLSINSLTSPTFRSVGDLGSHGLESLDHDLSPPSLFQSKSGMSFDSGLGQLPSIDNWNKSGNLQTPSLKQMPSMSFDIPAFDPAKDLSASLDAFAFDSEKPDNATFSAPQSAPIELPEAPEYVEKYYNFLTAATPNDILDAVLAVLEADNNVDFRYKSSKQKVAGIYYNQHVAIKFKIYLWKKSQQNMIEVVRRNGCTLAFSKFYRRFRESVNDKLANITTEETSAKQAIITKFGADIATLINDIDGNTLRFDEETLTTLCKMLDCASQTVEAAQVLAEATAQPDNCQLLSKIDNSKIYDSLLRLLNSPWEDAVRLASTIIANISDNLTDDRSTILSHLLPTMLEILDRPEQSLTDRACKREICRAMYIISQTHGSKMQSAVPSLYSVSSQSCASEQLDARTSEWSQGALSHITAV